MDAHKKVLGRSKNHDIGGHKECLRQPDVNFTTETPTMS